MLQWDLKQCNQKWVGKDNLYHRKEFVAFSAFIWKQKQIEKQTKHLNSRIQ